MKLHEYQSKRLLAAQGIPVPEGEVADSVEAAQAIAERLGGRLVVKAQVLVGGRGKAGGIVLVETTQHVAREAKRLLGSSLKGMPIQRLLIERAAHIAEEVYAGLVVDRTAQRMALIVSSEGGVDIEEVARTHPQTIHTFTIDPLTGLRPYHATRAALAIDLPRPLWPGFHDIVSGLYQTAQDTDATLAEINPLVITETQALLAVDAKMIIDDSALFRHPDLAAMRDPDEETPVERQAREMGISYVHLDGRIGCMVNGAGLAMATMDVIKLYGGEPANFLDIGGGARAQRVVTALQIILSDPHLTAVLINIFGGITRCDEVAEGIVEALGLVQAQVPIIIRLVGTNGKAGRRILEEAGLSTATTLSEGARLAVAAARKV